MAFGFFEKEDASFFRLDFFFYHGKFETSLFETRGLNRGMGPDNPGGAVEE